MQLNQILCQHHYRLINNNCEHYLWPFSFEMVIGSLLLAFGNSLATIAGIGGASVSLAILVSFFDYLPKDATLVVFACVLGAASGNTFNLFFKKMNDRPLIQYQLIFISVPIMLTTALIGIIMNKFFPSLLTFSIIIYFFSSIIKKTYVRFQALYNKENQQNLLHGQKVQLLHEEGSFSPLQDVKTVYILKNLLFLIAVTAVLSLLRGSSKFPSLIGVKSCSFAYWILFILSFIFTIMYAYRNILIYRTWKTSQPNPDNQSIKLVDEHFNQLVVSCIGAGIISGFGLGGGIFLIPVYRKLGCNPLQTTATCVFAIFLNSFVNCIQLIFIGGLQVSEFGYFFLVIGLAAFVISKKISQEVRKRNRYSVIEGMLLVMTVISVINLPLSLYQRVLNSNYNYKIILEFGSLC